MGGEKSGIPIAVTCSRQKAWSAGKRSRPQGLIAGQRFPNRLLSQAIKIAAVYPSGPRQSAGYREGHGAAPRAAADSVVGGLISFPFFGLELAFVDPVFRQLG